VEITFLPVGADSNTAAYRAVDGAGVAYFVKLRLNAFDEMSVLVPALLSERGIAHILAPVPAGSGQHWTGLDSHTVIVYPFVDGRDGYEVAMTGRQWTELGTTLRRMHTTPLPPELRRRVRRETYEPRWREGVRRTLASIDDPVTYDGVATRLVAFLRAKRDAILDLVGRAERLAAVMRGQPRPFVLCHSDLHAGNVLIDAGGAFYIVDWDDPILAPKERDLMFIGGAQGLGRTTPDEEEAMFYRGYGPTDVDQVALAYYRYERIVVDIAIFCDGLLSSPAGGDDREQSLRYLMANFEPGGTIEVAYARDRMVGPR